MGSVPPAPWHEPARDVLADASTSPGSAYDPIPVHTRTTEKNWQGILSLILGLLGWVVLAAIFGLMGLRSYKREQADNRGLAIAGLSLAGGWLVLQVVGVISIYALRGDTIDFASAQAGDCFTSSLEFTDDLDEGYYVFSPCSEETNGIVYYVAYGPDLAYSDPALSDGLWEACTTPGALAGVDVDIAGDYYVEYFIGDERDWESGDRRVVCGFSNEGGVDYAVLTYEAVNYAS
jgi:hypothetical protein